LLRLIPGLHALAATRLQRKESPAFDAAALGAVRHGMQSGLSPPIGLSPGVRGAVARLTDITPSVEKPGLLQRVRDNGGRRAQSPQTGEAAPESQRRPNVRPPGEAPRQAPPPGRTRQATQAQQPATDRRGETMEQRTGAALRRRRLDPARPDGPFLQGIMVGRDGWGSRYDPDADGIDDMDLRDVGEIIFHHSGGGGRPRDVERRHRRANKWADIGYHYMIDADGLIFSGRSPRSEGSHVKGRNRNTIGIAFLGNYANRPLTRQQMASARALIQGLMRASGRDHFEYSTHGEYNEEKRDELRGAFSQLRNLERDLAAVQEAIGRAPENERAALADRYVEEARRQALSAYEDYWRQQRLRWERYGHYD
jgi:hypothetical protein